MLVVSAVAVSLGYGIVAPVLPQYAKSFGVTTTAATVVVSAFAFMRLAFAPVSGSLSHRFGERAMYMTGIVAVAVSSAASALAQSYWQLLVVRALGGIGSVMFSVAAMSLIIKLSPVHARGRASAAYGSGFLLGSILGPSVGGLLAPLGFRWPFIIYAVLLLVSTVIVGFAVPANADGHVRSTDVEPVRTPMTVREALELRRFKIVLLTAFAQGWTNFGVRVAVVPLLAASLPGAPTWLPGGALMAFAAGSAVALTRSGYFSDVYGRKVHCGGGVAGLRRVHSAYGRMGLGVVHDGGLVYGRRGIRCDPAGSAGRGGRRYWVSSGVQGGLILSAGRRSGPDSGAYRRGSHDRLFRIPASLRVFWDDPDRGGAGLDCGRSRTGSPILGLPNYFGSELECQFSASARYLNQPSF